MSNVIYLKDRFKTLEFDGIRKTANEEKYITSEIHHLDGSTTYIRELYTGDLPIEMWG